MRLKCKLTSVGLSITRELLNSYSGARSNADPKLERSVQKQRHVWNVETKLPVYRLQKQNAQLYNVSTTCVFRVKLFNLQCLFTTYFSESILGLQFGMNHGKHSCTQTQDDRMILVIWQNHIVLDFYYRIIYRTIHGFFKRFGACQLALFLWGASPPWHPAVNFVEHEPWRTWYMFYDHSTCVYYDRSIICMSHDHSTCTYYDHSTLHVLWS